MNIGTHQESKRFQEVQVTTLGGSWVCLNHRITVLSPLTFRRERKSTTDSPVSNGSCYGFVLVDGNVLIAQGSYCTTNYYYSIVDHITPVLWIFSKSGGKNGKHGWVPQVATITSASNIAIQVFQSLGHRRFRVSHSTTASNLCIKRFRLLASAYFLCALTNETLIYFSFNY